MKDWKLIAQGYGLNIPEQDLEALVLAMDRLEDAFRPLVAAIPLETESSYVELQQKDGSK
jgi:hypothetical protein